MLTEKFLLHRRRDRLSAEALDALEGAIGEVRVLPARQPLVYEDQTVVFSTLLIDGFVCRYVEGRAGQRQMVALHVPGDFVDLHSFPLERMDHAVFSLTDSKVASVRHDTLVELMSRHPELIRMLWFSTMLDAAMSREWIFRLGNLPARGRVTHFFCELALRLRAVGLGDGDTFVLPLMQADIADACGLTPEHVNRVLRQLREGRVLQVAEGKLMVENWDEAFKIGQFDPGYLYIETRND